MICLRTGKLSDDPDRPSDGMWIPIEDAEPHYEQRVMSRASAHDRTDDGRFDRSHLSPEKAYRIGRDYLAHCIRYGWPMKVIKDRFGPGARIIEFGCGKELPMFRTLTCDHSAITHYKPSRYVGVDLNPVKYNPKVNGIESTILGRTNCVTEFDQIPDEVFDMVTSFEVIEHMGKFDGEEFLDAMFKVARRVPERENKPGLILLSTPVNGGTIAKNHVYEYGRSEMRRMFERRGGVIVGEFATFSNIRALLGELTDEEVVVWNRLTDYHSPDVLTAVFSALHPEVGRNIAWLVEVPVAETA